MTMSGNSILGVFAKSPIKPLEKHMRIAAKCGGLLIPFFKACNNKDWQEAADIRKKISEVRSQTLEVRRQISDFRRQVSGSRFL